MIERIINKILFNVWNDSFNFLSLYSLVYLVDVIDLLVGQFFLLFLDII